MVSRGRHDQSAAKAQHPSPTSSASVPAVAKVAAGSSVGHQQEATAKKSSSGSEPGLTQTTSHDAGRGQLEVPFSIPNCLLEFRNVIPILEI